MSTCEKDCKNFSKYFIRGKDLQFLSSKSSENEINATIQDVEGDDVPF